MDLIFLITALKVHVDREPVLDTTLQLQSLRIFAVRYDDVGLKKHAVTFQTN
jgi:hypothetical protein